MKKTLTILAGILMAFSSYSQNPNTFRKIMHFSGDSSKSVEAIHGIAKLDTTYVLLITVHTDTTIWDILIVEIDRYGNPLKEYYLSDPDKRYMPYAGQAILVDRDTNIVVTSSLIHTDGQTDGYILKLTPGLDTVWSNSFMYTDTMNCQDPAQFRPWVIEQTPDGGYIVGFKYYIDCIHSSATSRRGLLKLDAAGQEQWRKYYTDKDRLQSIAVTDSGNFVFNDWFNGYAVVKTDSLGNVLWNKNPGSTGYKVNSTVALKDDYIISVAPYIYNSPVSNPNDARFGVEIAKMDLANGHVIWNKRYRAFWSFDQGTIVQNFEIRILDNEDIVLAGTTLSAYIDSVGYDVRGILFKFNSQGDSLWCRLYDHDRERLSTAPFNDLVLTDDGGFLAVGWFINDVQFQHSSWLVKTDSMGMAPGVIYHDPGSYTQELNRGAVKTYPNPATEHIHFDLSALQHPNNFELTIYNIHGQAVKQRTIDNAHPEVSLPHLPPGVYLYRLQNQNDREVYEGKFIKK